MTYLILPMFTLIIFATGVAIDLARHEAARIDLQNAMDRGALASCSANNVQEAQGIVRRFVDARTFRKREVTLQFDPDIRADGNLDCFMNVSGRYELPSLVMQVIGLRKMGVAAASTAIQSETGGNVKPLEISLVLDISGSMARELTGASQQDRRLDVLRTAAEDFVTDIFDADELGRVSMSLVPYSGQVNAGPLFDPMLLGPRIHPYANSCLEFADSAFDRSSPQTFGLPPQNSLAHVPHFQHFSYERLRGQTSVPIDPNRGRNVEWGWCPDDEMAIVPVTGNKDAIVDVIRNFHGHDGTGAQYGLKWGLALLSPDTRDLIEQAHLDLNNGYRTSFVGRPAAIDGETQKVLVIMTDGNTRFQIRPSVASYQTSEDINAWAEPDADTDEAVQFGFTSAGAVFARNKASYRRRADQEGPSIAPTLSGLSTTADEALRVQQFRDLCDVARGNGITVFTIGFDIPEGSTADQAMAYCATVPSNYFPVNGDELAFAFELIAGAAVPRQLTP
ncbi:MAG: Tad domain-containing protein [Pseudomonadota bacterium]